jgi:hypothetical protein
LQSNTLQVERNLRITQRHYFFALRVCPERSCWIA